MGKYSDRATLQRVLYPAPGPCPWYLKPPEGTWGGQPLTWKEPEKKKDYWCLVGADGPVVILGYYAFTWWRAGNVLLVCFQQSDHGPLSLHWLQVDSLQPILDAQSIGDRMEWRRPAIHYQGAKTWSCQVPSDLPSGVNRFKFTEPFNQLGEVLFPADSSWSDFPESPHNMKEIVLAMRPAAGEVEVLPQDWFNNGDYDFGYQWPTRYARDPQSRRIFGEGIRIGAFVLDDSGRQVEKWLHTSAFYWANSLNPPRRSKPWWKFW